MHFCKISVRFGTGPPNVQRGFLISCGIRRWLLLFDQGLALHALKIPSRVESRVLRDESKHALNQCVPDPFGFGLNAEKAIVPDSSTTAQ